MPDRRQSALYIATRWPYPVQSGRQRMIAQTLDFLAEIMDLSVVVISASADGAAPLRQSLPVVDLHTVGLPKLPKVLANLVLRPGHSLQENFYYSRQADRLIHDIICKQKPDVVICDMLRTGQFLEHEKYKQLQMKKFIDLDDLLSERYLKLVKRKGGGDILGTFAKDVPWAVKMAANSFAPVILRWEARRIQRREDRSPAVFDGTFLVSHKEAERLRQRTGHKNIYAIPPAVTVKPVNGRDPGGGPKRFAFLGNLNYLPNIQSLRFLEDVFGVLARWGVEERLLVVGKSSPQADAIMQRCPAMEAAGYIGDLADVLCPGTILLAPILSGTGVKMKILDGMQHGVPILTTSKGIEGLDVEDGRHLLVHDDVEGFAEAALQLLQDGERMQAIARQGYDYVVRYHHSNDVRQRFLGQLQGGPC